MRIQMGKTPSPETVGTEHGDIQISSTIALTTITLPPKIRKSGRSKESNFIVISCQ